jgi:hypothetical protein
VSDTALMEKYNVSAVGLEDILKKLDELGITPALEPSMLFET